jgi:hypothetical protein
MDGDKDVSIAQVFHFPVDDLVRAYCGQDDRHDRRFWMDGREYIRLGYVYLLVYAAVHFACVSFSPAAKSMARLFVESPAIRGYFLDVLEQSHALVGAINTGWGPYYLLEDPN